MMSYNDIFVLSVLLKINVVYISLYSEPHDIVSLF